VVSGLPLFWLFGATLQERGVGLRVLEQGIDTSTAEDRAMFGMLSALTSSNENSSPRTPATGSQPPEPGGEKAAVDPRAGPPRPRTG
jgi:hypothetical protein